MQHYVLPVGLQLQKAIEDNQEHTVRNLLQNAGVEGEERAPDPYGDPNDTMLGYAARLGRDVSLLRALWDADFNSRTMTSHIEQWTALEIAASTGHAELVQALVDWGRDEWTENARHSALSLAASRWHAAAVTNLLAAASVDSDFHYSPTALGLALIAGSGSKRAEYHEYMGTLPTDDDEASVLRTISALLDAGADVNFADPQTKTTPLHSAARAAHNALPHSVINFLLSCGACHSSVDSHNRTPLFGAIEAPPHEIPKVFDEPPEEDFNHSFAPPHAVSVLLDAGATPHTPEDVDGDTPLHLAARQGSLGMLQALLSRLPQNITVTPANSHGETLLHAAASGHNLLAVRYLLHQQGASHSSYTAGNTNTNANANARSTTAWTPLLFAVRPVDPPDIPNFMASRAAVVRLLLDAGADPNIASAEGWTPLHRAAEFKDEELVRLLVSHGADVNAGEAVQVVSRLLGDEGYKVREELDLGGWRVRKALQRLGEDAEKSGVVVRRTTPAHWAAVKGDEGVLKVLMELGADEKSVDGAGKTPKERLAEFRRWLESG